MYWLDHVKIYIAGYREVMRIGIFGLTEVSVVLQYFSFFNDIGMMGLLLEDGTGRKFSRETNNNASPSL